MADVPIGYSRHHISQGQVEELAPQRERVEYLLERVDTANAFNHTDTKGKQIKKSVMDARQPIFKGAKYHFGDILELKVQWEKAGWGKVKKLGVYFHEQRVERLSEYDKIMQRLDEVEPEGQEPQ